MHHVRLSVKWVKNWKTFFSIVHFEAVEYSVVMKIFFELRYCSRIRNFFSKHFIKNWERSHVLGGIESSIFIIFWANVTKKKNLIILSKNLVQKKNFMVIEYSTALECTIEKKFSSFLHISHKALDDACKVLSKESYPHVKNPEKFFWQLNLSEFSSDCND